MNMEEQYFPKLIDVQVKKAMSWLRGPFKFCGCCDICNGKDHNKEKKRRGEILYYFAVLIIDVNGKKKDLAEVLVQNEYILACSLGGRVYGNVSNQSGPHSRPAYNYLTTHGRIITAHPDPYGSAHNGNIHTLHLHSQIKNEPLIPLSQEYLKILSRIEHSSYSNNHVYFEPDKIMEIISLYYHYHPIQNVVMAEIMSLI